MARPDPRTTNPYTVNPLPASTEDAREPQRWRVEGPGLNTHTSILTTTDRDFAYQVSYVLCRAFIAGGKMRTRDLREMLGC